MLNKLVVFFIFFSCFLTAYAIEKYVNYCKIYNPKKAIEYETYTRISVNFCEFYLRQCNIKYQNRCKIEMNGYKGLYNTNPSIATMHVIYNDDFDRPNN